MLKMVCSKCGSDDVTADANARWNLKKQTWEVSDIFDKGHYCNACDGECRIEEEELETGGIK